MKIEQEDTARQALESIKELQKKIKDIIDSGDIKCYQEWAAFTWIYKQIENIAQGKRISGKEPND